MSQPVDPGSRRDGTGPATGGAGQNPPEPPEQGGADIRPEQDAAAALPEQGTAPGPVQPRRPGWRLPVLAGVVTLVALLAGGVAWFNQAPTADGVATAGAGASTGADDGVSDEEKRRQFEKCLREHGVEVPESGRKGPGRVLATGKDAGKMREALEACRKYLPEGDRAPDRKMSAEDLEKAREFSRCMRENGVPNFPDPDPDGGGVRLKKGEVDDEALEAAMEKCRQYQPRPRRGSGGGA